ncbi:MAG: hypothetical protein FRX49_00025, partial [Trebouxia sp. A1-2]
ATSALDPVQQSVVGLRSSPPQEVARSPVAISMPAKRPALDDVVALSADDAAPQQQSTAVHAATLVKQILPNSQVVCPCSGRKHHFSCLSAQQQLQVVSDEEVWFSSPQHRQLSAELAGVCCRGPLPCGQVDESTPVTWQLIRGAAVADPQVLFAGRHVLLDCFGQLDDSRTSEDGRCIGKRLLDFSGFHVAVLANALAPLLLHHIEHTLLQAGVTRIIMPALPMPEAPSPEAPLPDQAALPVTASNPKPWGSLVGYTMPSPAQLLQACRTSMLQLPGTPYLIKQLSADSIVKVKPFTQGLRLNPEADAEALAHSGLLIPCTPETVVKPEPTLDPEPHLNPEVTHEPSDGVQDLPALPEDDVPLEGNSTVINGVTCSADIDAFVGVDGRTTKQTAEAGGNLGNDEPADTVDEDVKRQGQASASGQ